MRQELISISLELFPAALPSFFAYSDILQETLLKGSTVASDPFPMVKFFVIAKQLAPLHDACVDKVAIHGRPELAFLLWRKKFPLNMVVREIPRQMAAEQGDSSNPFIARHDRSRTTSDLCLIFANEASRTSL